MRRGALLLLAILTACASAPSTPQPRSGDDFDIETTVLAEYNVLSGPAGRRDWGPMKELFALGARMMRREANGELVSQTVDEYIAAVKPQLDANALFEHPTSTHIDRSGDTARVSSAYESRHKAGDAQPFAHGIDSIELVRTAAGWKIAKILRQPQ
jgi:hypothetical protein